MKARLVYNISNSITYFSLVTKIKIRVILLSILCLKQYYHTSYGTVFLHALFTTKYGMLLRWLYAI